MSGEFLKSQTKREATEEKAEKTGFMAGQVIRNCDKTRIGRVKVKLYARGNQEIWARVVKPDNGMYFMPQVDDEVLVGFLQGDGNEAYVMGQLWNANNLPPRQQKNDSDGENDPVNKRVILTPKKLEISFDDEKLSIVIKTEDGQYVTLKPDGIEIGADDKGNAVVTLDKSGNISIKAANKISFSAPEIELNAQNNLTLSAGAIAELHASTVKIN